MYNIIKLYNREVKGNSKCKICPLSYKCLDYLSSESIVTDINRIKKENFLFNKGNKESNTCKYKIQL